MCFRLFAVLLLAKKDPMLNCVSKPEERTIIELKQIT